MKKIILFLCCWYLILCTVHYTRQRELWLDEHSVYKSVAFYQPHQFFTEKLDADQIFPRPYLFLINRISEPFDFNLLSLRFLSFAAMISAFLIWLRIARDELKDQLQYLTFVLSWCGSALLIYYSAELKQYSMDVLAGALFLWFVYNQERLAKQENKTPYLVCLISLPLLGLLSYPAFMFLIFPLYNLFQDMYRDKGKKPWQWIGLAGYGVAVLIALAVVYFFDLRINQADTNTQNFQSYSISFKSAGDFFETWGEGTKNLFSRWFADRPRIFRQIAVFFGAFGLIRMVSAFVRAVWNKGQLVIPRRLASIDLIGFILYAELFTLSALGKYPFSVPRTALFFCPVILVMMIKGMTDLEYVNKYFYRVVHALYLLFLTVVSVGIASVVLTRDFSFSPLIW